MAMKRGSRLLLLFFLILLGAAVFGYRHLAEKKPPEVTLSPLPSHATRQTVFTLQAQESGSGLQELLVQAVQGEKEFSLLQQAFEPGRFEWNGEFTLDRAELQDGPLEIRVFCSDRSWTDWGNGNLTLFRLPLILDTQPPQISVLTRSHNLNQGGSGLIAYRVSEEIETSGVMVGDRFFPGYRQDSGVYLALFAVPYQLDPVQNRPRILARDQAGNEREVTFPFHGNRKTFKRDSLNISQGFLDLVMPQFQAQFPDEKNLLDLYLRVNRELRSQNLSELLALGTQTSPSPLWDGVFIRQPRAAPRAGFADHRTYYHQGEIVDEQVHTGVDLASVALDDILASNRGRVVFNDVLGIYGQAVILDHGLGLQTLYAHLSHSDVPLGKMLEKGQVLGASGMTGLAAGDHLHFEVLISGQAVNPVEWWDPSWTENNIFQKLELVR